jgi:hypothetical protein
MANVHSSACSGPARAGWILLFVTCGLSAVPFVGFGAWLIAGPVLLTTFILSIIVLSRGGTVQGLNLLVMTIIGAPLFISIAPVISSLVGLGSASSHTYPTSPVEATSPSSDASPADAATIRKWVDGAAKRGEEWGKQPDLTANAGPPFYGTPSAGPTYSPAVRKALPVEPAAAPSTTPLVATYRVVNDVPKGILNLREGPGSAYRALVIIKAGRGGIRIGESRYNGPTLWRKIWVGPHTGWVNQEYLEADSPTP